MKTGRDGHRKYLPRAFTKHGAVMLATVLNSPQAIQVGIAVIEAFVRLRHVLDANRDFAANWMNSPPGWKSTTGPSPPVFDELRRLAQSPEPPAPRGRIGFRPNRKQGSTTER